MPSDVPGSRFRKAGYIVQDAGGPYNVCQVDSTSPAGTKHCTLCSPIQWFAPARGRSVDPSCLVHCLRDSERTQFEESGYLVIENALSPEQLARMHSVFDRLLATQRAAGLGPHDPYSQDDILCEDPVFRETIDCETTFPKVWGILGWNIYLYHAHLGITPPSDPNPSAGSPSVAWHQDSMRVNDEIESSPRPRLSLKVSYYISDVSEPGRGNTLIVPGSHLHDEIEVPQEGDSSPSGAIPICVSPGTAVIIDRRLWHSRSLNHSEITRKALFMGYSYRWLRPKDEMTVEHLYPDLDPIQGQILGNRPNNNSCYAPADDDVPLRTWLRQYCPADAAWTSNNRRQSYRPDINQRER